MFGLGMGELLVILAIALLFLGPKKLPDLAASLGKAIRSFRKATSDLSNQLEVDESVKQPLRELKAALRDEPPPVPPMAIKPPAEPPVSVQKSEPPAPEPATTAAAPEPAPSKPNG